MSKLDYSRDKSGTYAIIAGKGGYRVVQVLIRDTLGNVTRRKRNVLSSPKTIEEGQRLLDTWASIDSEHLVERFEEWEKKQSPAEPLT